MLNLVALALLVADPAPQSTPARLVGDASVGSLFSADDYPAAALERGEQGRVQVIVHVDSAGAVSGCEIKQSSGSPSLDAQTCAIITQRAKFFPARDSAGRPVPGESTHSVVWALQNGSSFTPSDPWGTSMILAYGPDKKPGACRMEPTGYTLGKAPESCSPEMVADVLRSALPGLPDGPGTLIASTDFRLGPAAPLKLGPGDVLMERSVAEVSVDAAGRQVGCRMIEAAGPLLPAEALCSQNPSAPYKVRTDAEGKAVPFTATIASAMIAHVGAAPAPAP